MSKSAYITHKVGFYLMVFMLVAAAGWGVYTNQDLVAVSSVAMLALVVIFEKAQENNKILHFMLHNNTEVTEAVNMIRWYLSMKEAAPQVIEDMRKAGAQPLCTCDRCQYVRMMALKSVFDENGMAFEHHEAYEKEDVVEETDV